MNGINDTDETIRADFMRGAEMTRMFARMLDGDVTAEIYCDTNNSRGQQVQLVEVAKAAGFVTNIFYNQPKQYFFLRASGYGFSDTPIQGIDADVSSNVYAALGMYSEGGLITQESAERQWEEMTREVKRMSGIATILEAVLGGLVERKRNGCGMGTVHIESVVQGKRLSTNVCIKCMVDAVQGDDEMLERIKSSDNHLRAILMVFLQGQGVKSFDTKVTGIDPGSVEGDKTAVH